MNWRKIVVPLDGSPTAEAALATAVPLARATGATLLLLSVAESVLHGTRLPVLVVHPEPAPLRTPTGQAQPAGAG